MASDLGATAVPVEFIRGGTLGENWVDVGVLRPTRSICGSSLFPLTPSLLTPFLDAGYARYIDWTITTPLLLLELALTTALPLSQVFGLIFFGEFSLF